MWKRVFRPFLALGGTFQHDYTCTPWSELGGEHSKGCCQAIWKVVGRFEGSQTSPQSPRPSGVRATDTIYSIYTYIYIYIYKYVGRMGGCYTTIDLPVGWALGRSKRVDFFYFS